jgi:hypothetical protein
MPVALGEYLDPVSPGAIILPASFISIARFVDINAMSLIENFDRVSGRSNYYCLVEIQGQMN